MELKFIQNQPALVFNKNLVIADIHLGLEYELYKSGINVPSQTEKMKKKIDQLIKKTKPNRLIFLGDIKHQIPGVSWQELKEVPEFFEHFSKASCVHPIIRYESGFWDINFVCVFKKYFEFMFNSPTHLFKNNESKVFFARFDKIL